MREALPALNPDPSPVWHALEAAEVLARVGSARGGLSEAEARARLARVGPNAIREAERAHPARIALHQFAGALMYVLMAAMAVSLVIGHWQDAIVIGIVLVLNAVIGFFQEYRAENAIASLMGLVTPAATVEREGARRLIASRELVPGDLVWLQSGDLVPADLRILSQQNLELSEAALTGESLPVAKTAERVPGDHALPVAERRNLAFMGTSVASGRACGVVVATGGATQIGDIAREIRSAERAPTPLQRRMGRFGVRISIAVLGLAALAFGVGLLRGEAPAQMFLTAVAIAVSAVPEGLPVVMTIALAVSVRRMARRRVIVRRLPAVETLGSCTVIVTDKTGTLTENRMSAQELVAAGARRELLVTAVLCNEASDGGRGDPTEVALLELGARAGLDASSLRAALPQTGAVPFESERQWAATLHRGPDGPCVLVKGAPERVLAMCRAQREADGGEAPLDASRWSAEIDRMAENGLRVLGLARGAGEAAEDLVFLGLVGLLDPPRAETPAAIAACRRAGIRVLMVTGDHARTACAVARRVGLPGAEGPALAGAALARMSDAELAQALKGVSVFARVSPADKLRIVRLLSAQGEVVAVTGDGVNDAPALKAAHVGAAMGRGGTDVAREASEIVLTDDDFASIAAAVEEGRTAFANLRKATLFLVSSGVGELLAILGSLALRLPLPLLPAQILWLNVVTNGVEDVALAVEPPEVDEFARPPRSPREGILNRLLLERLLLAGAVMAVGTLAVFLHEWGGDPARLAYARVAALTALVASQVVHVGNCRSEQLSAFAKSPFSNRFLLLGALGSLLLHVGAMYLPATQQLLSLEPLAPGTWLRIAGVALAIVAVVELHKWLRRTR